ncbi:MAG: DUF4317 family protein [Eubacteriales bacterium]|nr:DUF4317 family protein [Eubacteriales bacterium]
MHIDRSDMLELTRRMTLSRNCFSRLAGAYMDEEGFIDNTFHINFLKLSAADREANLKIAKTIPFARTNVELKNYRFEEGDRKPGGIWQLLMALKSCELKNDALLYNLYEYIGERYPSDKPYAIYVFYGSYDVPVKGINQEEMWESEEVYQFLIGAICPLTGEYEAGPPEKGFLFPAFSNRSSDPESMNIFDPEDSDLLKRIFFD